MPLRRHRSLLALLLFPLASCASATASDPRVAVRIDPDAVEVRRSLNTLVIEAPVEIVNTGTRSVHIAPCGMSNPLFYIQKQRGGTWEDALYQACLLVASPSIRLRPGEALHTTAWFHTYVDSHSSAGIRPEDVPGTYRFVAVIYSQEWRASEARPPAPLPEEQRASQPFQITG